MLSHSHPELAGAECVVFVNSSRRYVDCSDAVCDLLGYSRAELLNKTIDDISYDLDQVPPLFSAFLISGQQQGDYVLQSKDRTPVPIRYRAFVFADGCKAAVWQPVRDWRQSYLQALLETNPAKQAHKLELALVAIRQAQQTLSRTAPAADRQAVQDALAAVQALMRSVR